MQNAGWERIPGGVDSSDTHAPRSRPSPPTHPRRSSLSADPRPESRAFASAPALCGEYPAPAFGAAALLLGALALAAMAPAAHASGPPASKPVATAHDTTTRNAVVIEGDNHLFMISAPEGWVLDDTSGMGSRIRCVFYPKGQKWATAPTVMYVNPLHGYGAKARTVSALIAEDEKSFRQKSPHGKVTEGGTLQTTGKKTAVIRYFSSDGGPAHEAVAYVPEAELVMLLVLSSKTPEGFQGALPAYREMVQSYAWVASNAEMGR